MRSKVVLANQVSSNVSNLTRTKQNFLQTMRYRWIWQLDQASAQKYSLPKLIIEIKFKNYNWNEEGQLGNRWNM